MADRTYTEKEVAILLERAAEMQALEARRREHRPGLTLDELASVAGDAGLDPSLLRMAAAELDQPHHTLSRSNSGLTSTHVFVERRVPGTLTPELWEDVVADLRHHFDSDFASMMGVPKYSTGTTEQIGRTLEWRHTSMSGIETKCMIRPREDQLDVRMSQRVGWASPPAEGSVYGLVLALFIGLISGGLLDSGGIGLAVFLVSLIAAVPLIIYADGAWRERKLRELEALADRLTSIVASPVEDAAASPTREASQTSTADATAVRDTVSTPDPSSRIDSSLLEDDEEPPRGRGQARRRSRDL